MAGPSGRWPATVVCAAGFTLLHLLLSTDPTWAAPLQPAEAETVVAYWLLVASALAFLTPAGLVLIGAAGLQPQRAWDAALGGLAAIGLAGVGYWAVGFALQFGGIGLIYTRPELSSLVWEWTALPPQWGTDWGMAGLSGWFLGNGEPSPLVYALFLAHLPWAITATLLPMLALRGRAPVTATLLLGLLTGSIIYPVAGNWVQGGGWLAALGRNLELGHGLVDFGGAGTVFLVGSSITLATLRIWLPRRRRPVPNVDPAIHAKLPPVHLPLLAIVGSFLLMAGNIGWGWANPLHADALGGLAPIRSSVNSVLYATGGLLIPLLYTWFVAGSSDPLMTARGLAAGAVAGLGAGPFVPPAAALTIGLLAGASVPLVTYLVDHRLRLNDTAGIVAMGFVPAVLGLCATGIWADGVLGSGWQATGVNGFLGVTGQGVSGLLVAPGFQVNFPGQLQAQMIGILALGLWGFLSSLLICGPLAIVLSGLRPQPAAAAALPHSAVPSDE